MLKYMERPRIMAFPAIILIKITLIKVILYLSWDIKLLLQIIHAIQHTISFNDLVTF